jgi:hypothetical protein
MGFGLQVVALVSSVVVILFLVGWRWEAVACAVDAAGIWVLNLLIAMVVNRPYPTPGEFGQVFSDLTRPSFPGGHVTSYIGIYGFVWFLVYTRVRQPWLRIPLLILLSALVVFVDSSRIEHGQALAKRCAGLANSGQSLVVINALCLYVEQAAFLCEACTMTSASRIMGCHQTVVR